jgi:hypothetical protein
VIKKMSIKFKKETWKKIALGALFVVNSSLSIIMGSEENKEAIHDYYRIAYEESIKH